MAACDLFTAAFLVGGVKDDQDKESMKKILY
jgi:hypothetical protein